MSEYGKVTIKSGVQSGVITVRCQYRSASASKAITVTYNSEQLQIEGPSNFIGTSGNVVAICNSSTVQPSWAIVDEQHIAQID